MIMRKRVTLMNTVREIHPDDININGFNTMLSTLENKIYCQYKLSNDQILDAFISRNLGTCTQIKFVKDLLGKLYTDDPWKHTNDFNAKEEMLIVPDPEY